MRVVRILAAALLSLGVFVGFMRADEPQSTQQGREAVSYYGDIRPIFQTHCHGCHQPAKRGGQYVMTSFDSLLVGGETGDAAIVPGQPQASYLIELIAPVDGAAEMPKGREPLSQTQVSLIREWIAQGAQDDTPPSARPRFDMEHPPTYNAPPVITSLDYSPDGKLLAVSGYHEVLLHNTDDYLLAARLVGLSERIESAEFSPDGKRLAITGGSPGRMGEVQIWDVAARQLQLSLTVGYDTIYGACWSRDGKLVAFGCPDNTIRAIDSSSGKQVLFNGAHEDWVLDTVFSVESDHLITVGRDRSAKLVKVDTQRFVDNITSITPGALKGGLHSIDRHPNKELIVVGGADGIPQIYRVFRKTTRVIGDNANLVRRFPAMQGRIFSVTFSPDGRYFAAGSSYNGAGQVCVYNGDFSEELPADIAKIHEKRVQQQTAAELAAREEYETKDAKQISQTNIPSGGIFAVAFSPDGQTVAAGGFDGHVWLIDATSGKLKNRFVPIAVKDRAVAALEATDGT